MLPSSLYRYILVGAAFLLFGGTWSDAQPFAAKPLTSRRVLTLFRGGERKWTDDLPPMPSEPPPPPPAADMPSDIMGGRGKTTARPGHSPYVQESELDKKVSWRSKTADATEEDYGLGSASTTKTREKAKTNLRERQPTRGMGASRGAEWSAIVEKNSRTKATSTALTFRESITVQQKLIAGGSSRAVAQCLLYPVDALRTLAQTRDHRTLADVGAKALVRGCATTSSFALFIGSIQFGLFGATRSVCGPVIASAIGAAGSCFVSVPQEVIKQRLVTGIYGGFREACATIYKREGVRGFYSAWRPTVARNVPFVVATFTANDFMKRKIIKDRMAKQGKNFAGEVDTSNELTIRENLLVGISSALIGAVCTHPADVVKTRMMTQAASTQVPYSSATDCILTMFKAEGLPAFYSGFVQRMLYMGPLWSIQFAINGRLCKSLEERNMKKQRK
mmetsp:Transcript_35073/g.76772  ORF Transcript_35073/g.76772 Transcript_35073/m.76772 type:complete len:449 (-) Transcript_35073:63-1409(-)